MIDTDKYHPRNGNEDLLLGEPQMLDGKVRSPPALDSGKGALDQ